MAETNPTATAKATTSVQAKKSSNIISWLAPFICVLAGYVDLAVCDWSNSNFTKPDPEWWFLAEPRRPYW